MRIFKFIVPRGKWIPVPDEQDYEVTGCLMIVQAENEAAARELAQRYGLENGLDVRWLKAARVIEFPPDAPAVLGYAEAP